MNDRLTPTVSVILDNLAAGESAEAIAKAYGYGLSPEDAQAALEYAAELARERILPLRADVA